MIEFILFCVFATAYAFGMQLLGRWLRSRGHGAKLEAVGKHYYALQSRISPLAPACGCWSIRRGSILQPVASIRQ